MNMPPPDGWQTPQQPGPPPNQGQPYGQSGYNPQQPPPGWQQGGWPQQPGPPPPQKGSGLKWLLIGVAVLLVIGITVGATLLFTGDTGGGGTTTSTSATQSDFASADDTGPVSVITDEPTCTTFLGINNSLGDVQRNGWSDVRGTLGPASEWTAEQRSQAQAVALAMQTASDQIAPLAKQTPHRVLRELYEQFIAYGRAYAESIADYAPRDDNLASANINISSTLFGICQSIEYGSASRSVGVATPAPPTAAAGPVDPDHVQPFIVNSPDYCGLWSGSADKFNSNTSEWQKMDPNTPGQWSPEQREQQRIAMPFVSAWAVDMEDIGRRSNNPTFEDFALTAATYLTSYVTAGDSYVSADGWLRYVSYKINQTILSACRAAVV